MNCIQGKKRHNLVSVIRLEDLELGTGEGVKQIVKVCFIADNGKAYQST